MTGWETEINLKTQCVGVNVCVHVHMCVFFSFFYKNGKPTFEGWKDVLVCQNQC